MQRKSVPRKSTRRPPQAPPRLMRQRAVLPKPARNKNMKSRTSVAAAYSVGLRSSEPRISGNYQKTNIKHRELISSVLGSVSFTVQSSFSINPGLSATFPWLSTQAQGWEQYRFNKLKFCYYTRTGSTTPGSVILVPDYDAADAAPSSEQIASAYRDVVEEVPWVEEFTCTLDPQAMFPNGPKKFIRVGALASNLDVKTYDAANFYVCTIDGTAINWGKIWVEYDIDFFVPQLPPSGALSSVAFGKVVANGSISNTAIFGATPTVTGGVVTAVTNTLTFVLSGTFLVYVTCTGTGMGNFTIPITGTATTSSLTVTNVDYIPGATSNDLIVLLVTATTGQTVIFNWSAVTSVTACTARLAPYNST